jgi:CheY-like chemotaxis protein/nucleoside 2-deoxyribosyltransferase
METKNTPRVLIADKWKTWADLFKDLLSNDYDVVPASTLQEAISQVQESEPPFHVVISDIQFTVDPSQDLELGQHTLLDKIRARGTYTHPVIVISHGPTPQQVRNIARNYNIASRYFLEKFPKGGGVFDHKSFGTVVEQATSEALEEDRKSRQDFAYQQLQSLAQEKFGVLPVFSGRLDPELYLVVLLPPDTSKLVYDQIAVAVRNLQQRHPDLKCRCIPYDVAREREKVWLAINEADLVIADLTGRDPDVFYEVGLCDALAKKLLLLINKDKEKDIPPHLSVFRQISYIPEKWGILSLATELKGELEEPPPAHPLGESRWTLDKINTQMVLALLHRTYPEAYRLSSKTTKALANYESFYKNLIKNMLSLSQWETKEVEKIFDSRHDAETAWRVINRAGVILANISPADPEILYAVGLAHAQNRPVILLTSDKEAMPISLR